jgi:choline-sulfatase
MKTLVWASPLFALVLACESAPQPAPNLVTQGATEPSGASTSTPATTTAAALPSASNPTGVSAAARPKVTNLLLLTIDSLRADMPWTGYERPIAPNLTQLASQSTVYTNAYSASSYTAKSVSALLTGRHPSTIYRSGWFFAGFGEANLFFTELLQKQGVRTLGGHGHGYFDRGKALDQGFDVWKVVPGIGFDNSTDKNVTGDKMTDMAIELLSDKQNSGGPFFMWLHYMDPHDQYIAHADGPQFGKKARDRYDSEVFFTDKHIGRLLDHAAKQPWWGQTAIVISADHGEAFGEHGMYKHAFELWEVLTRVPLIIRVPGGPAQRIEQRRASIDLAPTILELFGIKDMPSSFTGQSLVPELYGAPPDVREPIVLDLPEDHDNPERRAIISGDHKLIARSDGSFQLYDLKQDPGELIDLAKKQPETLAAMKKLYTETVAKMDVVAPFGGMKLKSGKRATGPTGPGETPKEKANESAPK